MRSLALCALAALATAILFAGSAPHAAAQGYYDRYYDAGPQSDRRDDALRDRMRYYSRDAVARRNADRRPRREVEVERPSGGGFGFFRRLFGGAPSEDESDGWRGRADQGAVEVRPVKRRPPRRIPPKPTDIARPAIPAIPGVDPAANDPAAALPAVAVAPAPVAPTMFVAVIGDSIADGLAGGLQEGFADAPEVAVKRLTKANSGLVRSDYYDFVPEVEKLLESGPINYAVFDVGVNDRQPFLDMRKEAPLTDAWRKRYAERLDAVLNPFKERKIPIYWVGLAASESNRATADHAVINALAKERVEAAGGTYVDVWEGFVDEDGDYADSGPMLDGQIGRLRLDDGVHFSKAGARKLSHYVEQEIRKVYQPKPVTPDAVMAAVSPEAGAEAAQPAPAAEQVRPISSPLMVLTAPRRSQGGALAAANPVTIPARDASASAARFLLDGESRDADPGRMDDYRWPGAPQKEAEQAAEPKPVSATVNRDASAPANLLTDPRPLASQPGR